MEYIGTALLGYLVGSIPSGLIIGVWFWQVDLRRFGSKNIGATNAFRTLGPGPALAVFAADAAKGVGGVWIGQWLTGGAPEGAIAGGIAAIMGHNWSLFLRFSGGRGVATGLGVIAVLMPKVTLIVVVVWAAVVYCTRYVSLGSIAAAALTPVCAFILKERAPYFYFGLLAAVFVIYRHKPNIKRLLAGRELKIKPGDAADLSKREK